jgi:hypothetical protein
METYGVDYGDLKPGLYLQRGGAIKAIDVADSGAEFNWLAMLGFDEQVPADELASKEAWTSAALARRGDTLLSIPHAWVRGETDLDDAPFTISEATLFRQIDKALQIKPNGAFVYKLRTAGGKLLRLIWLDPDKIEPDWKTATHEDGVVRFWREGKAGKRDPVAAQDVLWFSREGMGELRPDPAPLEGVRLNAETLYNIARMEDSFFEGSALPYMLINVPAGTPAVEQERVESRFNRIFNSMRNPREIKTIAVREGVTVQVLSFTPNDLALGDTVARHRQAILARMQVPESIVMSNAANYATAMSDKLGFAETMAQRFADIAEVINGDADIIKTGVTLDVRMNELPVMQEEETQRAQAFSFLVGGGLHPLAVVAILGFDVPEDYDGPLLADKPEPPPQFLPQPMPDEEDDDQMPDTKAVELDRLQRFIENGTYLKRPFTSDVLTPAEIEREIVAHDWREYP